VGHLWGKLCDFWYLPHNRFRPVSSCDSWEPGLIPGIRVAVVMARDICSRPINGGGRARQGNTQAAATWALMSARRIHADGATPDGGIKYQSFGNSKAVAVPAIRIRDESLDMTLAYLKGKDAESEEVQEHANSSSLALYA